MRQRWRVAWPLIVWLALTLIPPPAGLQPHQWRYFAAFAAAIVAMVLTTLPGGAIGLIAVTFIAAMRYVDADAASSIRWALGGFAEPTVWLTFGAFLFALGYRKSGLGRRIALLLVRRLGRRTLGLGYAVALADLALAPGTPSNTARSGGTIYPIVRQIPALYGCEPEPGARRIGAYLMWTAFASTAVTSSMFVTALVPNATAVALAERTMGFEIGWWGFFAGFAPAGLVLLALVPLVTYWVYPPEIRDSPETVVWAAEELRRMGPVVPQRMEDGSAGGAGGCAVGHRQQPGHIAARPRLPLHRTHRRRPGRDLADAGAAGDRLGRCARRARSVGCADLLHDGADAGRRTAPDRLRRLARADGCRSAGRGRSAAGDVRAGGDLLLVALPVCQHHIARRGRPADGAGDRQGDSRRSGHAAGDAVHLRARPDGRDLALCDRLRTDLRGSGFIGRGWFWWLGLVFGVLFFAVLAGVAGPWVLATMPAR